ncbi:MAG TPA: TonB-dependent siderophore receptor, partial [Burkholderiaceae bacterium]
TAPDPAAAGGATSAATAEAAAGAVQQVTIEGEAASTFTRNDAALAKLPADLKDVPQSVTVLSKALLHSEGATSLADALRNVPGITLGGAEGGQIGNNINLNGFTARTDIYLDGFRDRGQYYRDTFALDAVEVLMGPSSMLFGRGSTGGVVNQVSKVAQLRPVTEVEASVTTNGMLRSTADIDRAIDATSAWRVAAMAQEGRPTTRRAMKDTDFGLAPSLKLGIRSTDEITLSALLQRNHDMPDYGVPPLNGRPAPVDRDAFFGYRDDRTDQTVATFSAMLLHRFGGGATLRNVIQSNHVHVDARETASQSVGVIDPASPTGFVLPAVAATSSLPPAGLAVRLQGHDRVIDDHAVFDQADLDARFDTGPLQHELLAGAEIGQDTYANQSYTRTGTCAGKPLPTGYVGCEPLLRPVIVDTPAGVPDVPGNLAAATAGSTGLYVSDTVAAGPFKLVGGLRRDWFDARVTNTVTAPGRVQQDVARTSYRAGAIWQPTPRQSWYLSYSTSFDPSLEQLTNTTGTTAPLPPADNEAWEAGAKADLLRGRLSVDGAVFRITQDNARSQQADGSYAATGTVRVRGARVGASGEPVRGWKVFAGYTYLDAAIVRAIAPGTQGRVPANTPRDSATLWTTWDVLPRWVVGGGAVYQSRRAMNNTGTSAVPGYVRWDGMLGYHRKAYDVRLNLFNVFDRRYDDAIIASDGGRAVPGTGRSAMLSFSYHR